MKFNNKSGFTLLEIIIVIIIVGVLASLALPRFFSTIEYSRSTEALNALGVVRKSILRCSLIDNDATGCGDTSYAELDIDDPSASVGSHYSGYAIVINGAASYTITATRNGVDGGDGTSTIVLNVDTTGITRSGTGVFSSIK